jgi:hypothetical protein
VQEISGCCVDSGLREGEERRGEREVLMFFCSRNLARTGVGHRILF